ncbi:hypothetical protein ACQKMY_21905 [Peribacillus frigoritolerans]|uniref:hypothetical protein n=1 Tax=Peribacillus frigoritolerans TaxID=450367 RepID=UPI003D090359
MTYVNYLGCNHKLPIDDKYETEELGLIDETFFSDPAEGMENIRKHISSKYIYQVDTNGGGFDFLNLSMEDLKKRARKTNDSFPFIRL